LDTCLNKEPGKKCPKSLVYETYKIWCEEKKIVPKSTRDFNSRIKEDFGDGRAMLEGKTTVIWEGMELTHESITLLPKLPSLHNEKQKEMI